MGTSTDDDVPQRNTVSHVQPRPLDQKRWDLRLPVPQLLQEVYVGLVWSLRFAEAGDLQEERHVLETAVMEDAPEAFDADHAVTDVLMTVATGSKLHLRVVGV